MKTIVLIGCGKTKLDHAAPAKDLYTGPLFRKARAWAERVGDEWAILSAKHHLVMPDQVIEPYDLCLEDLKPDYYRQWLTIANFEIVQRWPGQKSMVRGYVHLSGERFICLAGALYAAAFKGPTEFKVETPLQGMGVGKRLGFLSREACA